MSTGRVLWIIWCCWWAGVWAVAAWIMWPRRACTEPMLFVIGNGPACAQWGATGSAARMVLFAMLAAASLALIAVPVGRSR